MEHQQIIDGDSFDGTSTHFNSFKYTPDQSILLVFVHPHQTDFILTHYNDHRYYSIYAMTYYAYTIIGTDVLAYQMKWILKLVSQHYNLKFLHSTTIQVRH